MGSIPVSVSQFLRKTWKPVVIEQDGSVTESKFSGKPLLQSGEGWPCCVNCEQPMQLFVQINLDSLPEPLRGQYGTGVLQLFYCTTTQQSCESECEAFFPHSRSTLVRVIPTMTSTTDIAIPIGYDWFPPKLIVDWQVADDYPSWQEADALGVELSDDEGEALYEAGYPRIGDKLSGWPYWVQGVEYPSCRICGREMRLVFQIDSEDNLPFMFGDSGCGHITQCPEHHAEVAFGWACC